LKKKKRGRKQSVDRVRGGVKTFPPVKGREEGMFSSRKKKKKEKKRKGTKTVS